MLLLPTKLHHTLARSRFSPLVVRLVPQGFHHIIPQMRSPSHTPQTVCRATPNLFRCTNRDGNLEPLKLRPFPQANNLSGLSGGNLM
jgi:hypothetical protein